MGDIGNLPENPSISAMVFLQLFWYIRIRQVDLPNHKDSNGIVQYLWYTSSREESVGEMTEQIDELLPALDLMCSDLKWENGGVDWATERF